LIALEIFQGSVEIVGNPHLASCAAGLAWLTGSRLLLLEKLDEIEHFRRHRFRQTLEVFIDKFGMGH